VAFGHKMQAKILHESTKLAPTLLKFFEVSQYLQVLTKIPNSLNVGHRAMLGISSRSRN